MRKAIFVCQIADGVLKVIKFQPGSGGNSKGALIGLDSQPLPFDIDDSHLAQSLNQAFKKLEYKNNRVVLSLSRSLATCRYLKVPTQIPREIEKIIVLQAPTYLPYPVDELITGHQIISTDKEGYSHINLVIVHKDIIERYIRIFKGLKNLNPAIVLSSYGACNLYSYTNGQDPGPVMLIDIDSRQVELAITLNNKLFFSRYFKLDRLQANWEQAFIDEINKTRDAYLKEIAPGLPGPKKIVILGANRLPQESIEALAKQITLPIEPLAYDKRITISKNVPQDILDSDNSFASLIGLGLTQIPEALNLLSPDIKEENRKALRRKERLRLLLFSATIIIALVAKVAKNLDNKALYLDRMKLELSRIAKEAGALEEIENRFKVLRDQSLKKPSSLDILYELHRIIPANISLTNLTYEEDSQVVLHSQTAELDSVFTFVAQLEKSEVFKTFNIKVRYATKKKLRDGEIVDFEIVCLKLK